MTTRREFLSPSVLEDWVVKYLDDTQKGGRVPSIRVLRRDVTNTKLTEAEDDDDGVDRLTMGTKETTKSLGSKSYVGILCCISFCHKLLVSKTTATQRELYYYYKGGSWSPWGTQQECNESISDVATLFDVPRYALGFKTAARGSMKGRLRIRKSGGRTWTDLSEGAQMITHDWLTEDRSLRSDARCVVVVEKEGVFQRLVEDGFDKRYPCILVTGAGVPDLPTRACVHKIRSALQLPVYGLVDWNCWGVGVLLTYKLGSARAGFEAHKYAVDIAWLGLRSSQVTGIPDDALQPLTDRDKKRGTNILNSAFITKHPAWATEISAQLKAGSKCELEALLLGDMAGIADFLEDSITSRDFLS